MSQTSESAVRAVVPAPDVAPPQGVRLLRDIHYGQVGDRRLTLNLMLPEPEARPAGRLPVIVGIHGGWWRGGSKEAWGERLVPFVQRGYAGASVGYRLSQEARFPAQIEDCKCAVRFLRAHAGEYGLDPDRIGAWGGSAGGHLVALLGTSAGVPELEGSGGWEDQSSAVQAVCDWFGAIDLLKMRDRPSKLDHDAPDSPGSQLVGGPVQEHPDRCAAANPITYITGDEPPFLILHGGADSYIPHHQSELLYEALLRAGDEATFYSLTGAGHGDRDPVGGAEVGWNGLTGLLAAFFDRHLKGLPGENWPVALDGVPATVHVSPGRAGTTPSTEA